MTARRLAVALAVSIVAAASPAAAGGRDFRPEAYFAGRTRSAGVLENTLDGSTSRFSGDTRGRRERDGSTTFDQTIRFDDGTTRTRRWRIVRTGPATIEATGSDIVGVAKGEVRGRELRLVSTIRGQAGNPFSDLDFDQVLTMQRDGTSVSNVSTVRKLGFVVREARETFRRIGGGGG